MIKEIRLTNIESHGKSVFELEQFNAFIGDTGTGKSVLLRALGSLFFFSTVNSRFDCKKSHIGITRMDGTKIDRYREDEITYKCECGFTSKSHVDKCDVCGSDKIELKRKKTKDSYIVNDDHDGPYKKMLRGWKQLDDDLKKIMPVAVIKLANGEPFFPGIRQQHDMFLWKELSPTNLHQVFAFIEGHDVVGELIKVAKKDLRESKNLHKYTFDDLELMKSELKSEIEMLDLYNKEYIEAESLYNDSIKLYIKLVSLVKFQNTLKQLNFKRDNFLTRRENVHVINTDEIKRLSAKLYSLDVLRKRFNFLNDKKAALDEQRVAIRDVSEIKRLRARLLSLYKVGKNIKDLVLKKRRLTADKKRITEELELSKARLKEEFINKGICPFSGYPLNDTCKTLIEKG